MTDYVRTDTLGENEVWNMPSRHQRRQGVREDRSIERVEVSPEGWVGNLAYNSPGALAAKVEEYFELCENQTVDSKESVVLADGTVKEVVKRSSVLPEINGLVRHLKISRSTWWRYGQRGGDYTRVYDNTLSRMYSNMVQGAAVKKYNPAFVAKLLGLGGGQFQTRATEGWENKSGLEGGTADATTTGKGVELSRKAGGVVIDAEEVGIEEQPSGKQYGLAEWAESERLAWIADGAKDEPGWPRDENGYYIESGKMLNQRSRSSQYDPGMYYQYNPSRRTYEIAGREYKDILREGNKKGPTPVSEEEEWTDSV